MPTSTVQRQIRFYRINSEPDKTGQPRSVDFREVLKKIHKLPFRLGDRYLDLSGGQILCVWPEQARSQPPRLRLGTVRQQDLPQLEDQGTISPLQLRGRQGIVEQTHVVFFEDGIVGVEFNFYGPRISRLGRYLYIRFPQDLPKVAFDLILNQDIDQKLEHLQDVHLLQIRLRRDYADIVSRASKSLPAALQQMSDDVNPPVMEMILRNELRSRKSLGKGALDLVRKIAGTPNSFEGLDVFKVKGTDDRTGRVETFDFLSDRLGATKTVHLQLDTHRGVNSKQMYGVIQEAYAELKDSLLQAASLS